MKTNTKHNNKAEDANSRALKEIKKHLKEEAFELTEEGNKITSISFYTTHLSLQHVIELEWDLTATAEAQINEIQDAFIRELEWFYANDEALTEIRSGYNLSVRELIEDEEERADILEKTSRKIAYIIMKG